MTVLIYQGGTIKGKIIAATVLGKLINPPSRDITTIIVRAAVQTKIGARDLRDIISLSKLGSGFSRGDDEILSFRVLLPIDINK